MCFTEDGQRLGLSFRQKHGSTAEGQVNHQKPPPPHGGYIDD